VFSVAKSVGIPIYMELSASIARGMHDYSVKRHDASSSNGHSSDGN
jgi:hypothetical protein